MSMMWLQRGERSLSLRPTPEPPARLPAGTSTAQSAHVTGGAGGRRMRACSSSSRNAATSAGTGGASRAWNFLVISLICRNNSSVAASSSKSSYATGGAACFALPMLPSGRRKVVFFSAKERERLATSASDCSRAAGRKVAESLRDSNPWLTPVDAPKLDSSSEFTTGGAASVIIRKAFASGCSAEFESRSDSATLYAPVGGFAPSTGGAAGGSASRSKISRNALVSVRFVDTVVVDVLFEPGTNVRRLMGIE